MKQRISAKIRDEILYHNRTREKEFLSRNACLSDQASRTESEKTSDRKNLRSAFFHDSDRIIHSLAYARYIDKTQVFYLFDNDHITHRVLHVQLVSKVARTIGRFLRLNEDLIEAIALGHDLGHVPFGHNGERKLSKILHAAQKGYFTHNAQSVRALTVLEKKGKLNLTLQVLDGILCRNGEWMLREYKPRYDKTWEEFEIEYESCWKVKDFGKTIIPMTLEGCVVRLSDIIAYIGRDCEDAIMLGLIKRSDIPAAAFNILGNTNRQIVDTIILDLVEKSYGRSYLTLSKDVFKAIQVLYAFSASKIYQNPKIGSENSKIDNMFDVLYQRYLDDLVHRTLRTSITRHYLPNMPNSYLKASGPEKVVIDYIAGMTDKFFNREFHDMMIPKGLGYSVKHTKMDVPG